MALETRIKKIKKVIGGKMVNGEQIIYKVVKEKPKKATKKAEEI